MRTMNFEEIEMVDGGFIKEVVKAIIVEVIIEGGKAVGGALIEYAETAPSEVFERERAML